MAGRLPSEVDRRIARRIKAARREAGLSMKDCATAIGVQYQQYDKYEAGRNKISAGAVLALADLFLIPVGRLFDPRTGRDLDPTAAAALRMAGATRGLSASEVGRRLIEAAARDGLIDAVLDDGVRTIANHRFTEAA